MTKRIIKTTVALFFISVLSTTAYGARFPGAIEKKIVLSGEAATLLSELFGLSTCGRSSVSLQLGKSDAWAVYLLKQDTKKKLPNSDQAPKRYNTVTYSKYPIPSLTIFPYWLDMSTKLPESKIGYYSFMSPFIFEKLDSSDTWTQLLRRLEKEPDWKNKGKQQFHHCYTSIEKIKLCIDVYNSIEYMNNLKRKGYRIAIEARTE